LKQKCNAEQHRRLELDLPAPHRADPVEDLDSRWNTHDHRSYREEAVGVGIHPDGEHVVRPHAHADEADTDRGCDHDWVSENRFSGKYRNDLRHKTEGGNNQDVHLGMSEYPEEMHPECGRSTRLRIEEMAPQITIDKQHDLRGGKRCYRDENLS